MIMEPIITQRDLDGLGMFNPLAYGDRLTLKGEVWQVGQGGGGWVLHRPGKRSEVHPLIHDISGMADFIEVILSER